MLPEETHPLRVMVTGGRDFSDYRTVCDALDELHATRGIEILFEGAARGADALARRWAVERKVPNRSFPADWDNIEHPKACVKRNSRGKLYDATAGLRRNTRMIMEGCPHVVVAFPGNNGTAHAIGEALARKIPVLNCRSSGRGYL